jgi:hypothetical protein
MKHVVSLAIVVGCGGPPGGGGTGADAYSFMDAPAPTDSPIIGGCAVFPANHIFNTQIGALPVDPASDAYITTIGTSKKLHLDLGQTVDQQSATFYGIPYNIVHAGSLAWTQIAYFAADTNAYSWHPADESECADAQHAVVSPCTIATPYLPIPQTPIVEGGINTTTSQTPDEDHHMLIVDADACRLWETYHSYSPASGTWNIFGSASWDLHSNALRTADWSSADAAGFPILPLLLRADEASTGVIKHALRFTIGPSKIRKQYVWPARHLTDTDGNTAHPPMGQLFRLKASVPIPDTFHTQSKAILQAMKTYGMYVADGGSDWYISGEPSASWDDTVFDEVQSVTGDSFEAVDITALTSRAGFDPNSGAVPP